jgi:alpha-D-ribose 1-methylphosphonate 5-triphosphate synthase subunit PhnG
MDRSKINRRELTKIVLSLPQKKVMNLYHELKDNYEISDIDLPQSGLAPLKMIDTAFGEPYYIGEIPIATAYVLVKDQNEKQGKGAAVILDDRSLIARVVAVIDAIFFNELSDFEVLIPFLNEGLKNLKKEESFRKKIVNKTKVDFSLLNQISEDESI